MNAQRAIFLLSFVMMSCHHSFARQLTLPDKPMFAKSAPPPKALLLAKNFLQAHQNEFPNQRYLSIIDYSQPSSNKRFYLIDLKTKNVEALLVAHGKGSDPQHTGRSQIFSDVPKSLATALGFYKTADTYKGSHGVSLKLIGLSETNKNAFARAIVLHGAPYVSEGRPILGRSWGCPAVEMGKVAELIEKIKGGSLLFAWHPKFF